MTLPNHVVRLAVAGAGGLLLAGCLLKPASVSARRFVLAPLPSSQRAPAGVGNLPVGINPVKMPAYLARSALAVRQGANEIEYLENALWAEPLDQGFQRTLGANVSALLPTEQVYLSAWQREQVKVRVFVTVEQFDVDSRGQGRLAAWWRITPALAEQPLQSGRVNLVRSGASPHGNPKALVVTLSELNAEFSRVVAKAIREQAVPEPRTGGTP